MFYSPLEPPEDAIRLLKIHQKRPTSNNSSDIHRSLNTSIECTLFHVRRQEKPEYKALSYQWGEGTEKVPICVNGIESCIGLNLYSALEHIQSENEDIVLWADAICINQDDAAEKSEQVKRMSEIYRNAIETIVWLGPADESSMSDNAMNYLDRVGRLVQEEDILRPMIEMAKLSSEDPERCNTIKAEVITGLVPFINLSFSQLSEFCKMSAAINELLSRPYWERVWILQEYALATALIIRCGTQTVSVERFHGAILALATVKPQVIQKYIDSILEQRNRGVPFELIKKDDFNLIMGLGLEIAEKTGIVQGLRSRYQSGQGRPLLRLLARVFVERTTGAGNPKDRVFALLGMATDAEELGIVPDYAETNTWRDVYAATARAIASAGQVDVLAFAQHQDQSQNGLPSWATDWTRSQDNAPQPILRPYGQLPWDTSFNASKGASPFTPHTLLSVLPKNKLPLYGYTIDSVEIAGSKWQPAYCENVTSKTESLETYLTEIAEFCKKSSDKLSGNEEGLDGRNDDEHTKEIRADRIHNPDHPRAMASYLTPIADMQQYGVGFIKRADPSFCHRGYEQVLKRLEAEQHHDVKEPPGPIQTEEEGSYYHMLGWQRNRRPFLGVKGTVGLAPDRAECGDKVVVFCGGKFPYIVRMVRGDGVNRRGRSEIEGELEGEMGGREEIFWWIIGEAYVHGCMYGEFFKTPRTMEEFILA